MAGGATQEIRISQLPDEPGEPRGKTHVELLLDGKSISRLYVVPFTIRVGSSTVRMDGIQGVGTEKEHRNRGYSRRVIEATLAHLRRGDAALTMLYGIPNFYPKFGYATAGGDHYVSVTHLFQPTTIPDGWTIRAFEPDDLTAVHRLYDLNTQTAVGAAVRSPDEPIWHALRTDTDCRVAVDAAGHLRACAWRGRKFWYTRFFERNEPDALVFSEVMADGPAAADAILAACRLWARELSETRGDAYRQVLISQPPEGTVAAAAARSDARLVQQTSRTGSSMARVLDVDRLLRALAPELRARLRRAPSDVPRPTAITFVTDIGTATLALPDDTAGETLTVTLPQTTLARFALGAGDPADDLNRVESPPGDQVRTLLQALFPKHHQHMYLPDRY